MDGHASYPADAPAPEVLEGLVAQAEEAGASDIHLRAMGGGAEVSYRLDGVMTPALELPGELAERVFGRIKFLAKLKTYQDSMPQDGRIPQDQIKARSDIRVATYPTVTGEKIVMRLFSSFEIVELERLGIPDGARSEMEDFLGGSSGMMLLTGPAGSGKTTTIYACLEHLADLGGRHIITVEDPVEQVIPSVMQTEVNEARGLTFAKAARHLMRQDPQVVVIGEIRDDETANIAIRAALTGHMVISTLHAGSCKGVLDRLMVMCEDRYATVTSLDMVINQRLVRKLCGGCGGDGCEKCLGTGYRGRVPVVEWMRVGDDIADKLLADGARGVGPASSLADDARRLVAESLTDEAEYQRVFGRK